ncbi:MAG: S8 family peptidase [Bacteroidales bacterium]|nr:S8 family peptidase [Bacteroidales bacterium]
MKRTISIILTMSLIGSIFAQSAKCDVSTLALVKQQAAAGSTQFRMIAKMAPGYDPSAVEKTGIRIGSKIGQMVTLTVPQTALTWLDTSRMVEQYTISHPIGGTYCQNTTFDTRTDSVKRGLGVIGDTAFDGRGVYIGITDWGFDYKHINYNNRANDNRRIKRVWDQFRTAQPHPQGYDYGTEIIGTDALFEAECDTLNIYKHGTHGTHVTGIAAGRGVRGSDGTYEYQGQAPYADLLMSSFLLDEASWIDAAAWMQRVANDEGRRIVINSSWGMYTFSSLEGQSLLSQTIDTMASQGVIFCTSAGNNGDVNFHLVHDFSQTQGDTLRTFATIFRSPAAHDYGEAGQALIMWGEPERDFKAQIRYQLDDSTEWTSPWYSTDSITIIFDTITLGTETIPITVMAEHDYPYGFSHRTHIQIDAGKTSTGTLELFITAQSGTVHAWNVWNLQNHAGNTGCNFYDNNKPNYVSGGNTYGISEPACASKCITVAAHAADVMHLDSTVTIGRITSFSSIGPLINGVDKPEISAPGKAVVSSLNSYRTDRDEHVSYTSSFNGEIYEWAAFDGTSMSSPAVSGIVALLLQANPNLNVDQVRECLFTTTRNDITTGPIRESDSISSRWGWGKVDALRAVNMAIRKLGITPAIPITTPLMVYPNPASSNVTVMTGTDTPMTLTVFAADGRMIASQTVTGETDIDISRLPRGVYALRVGTRVAKFVKQ